MAKHDDSKRVVMSAIAALGTQMQVQSMLLRLLLGQILTSREAVAALFDPLIESARRGDALVHMGLSKDAGPKMLGLVALHLEKFKAQLEADLTEGKH